jgi:hypothetical protein
MGNEHLTHQQIPKLPEAWGLFDDVRLGTDGRMGTVTSVMSVPHFSIYIMPKVESGNVPISQDLNANS